MKKDIIRAFFQFYVYLTKSLFSGENVFTQLLDREEDTSLKKLFDEIFSHTLLFCKVFK